MPIRNGCVFEGDCCIEDDLDTGYYAIFRSCKIGKNVFVSSHCVIDPRVEIGDNTRIQVHCYLSAGTKIGKDVFIGPGTYFLNDKYPPRYDKALWEPPVIKDGAIIGGGVVVCPRVTIGEKAIIGAGAVVTKDVPAGQVWLGVPARRVR